MIRPRYDRNRVSDCASCTRRANCIGCNNDNMTNRSGDHDSDRSWDRSCDRSCDRNDRCSTQRKANTCNSTANSCEAERLLTLIRRLDFALVETNLYLDTHPYSRTALAYFERLSCERKQAVERYEANYGPLTAAANASHDEWLWSTGAWPWQIDKESKR